VLPLNNQAELSVAVDFLGKKMAKTVLTAGSEQHCQDQHKTRRKQT